VNEGLIGLAYSLVDRPLPFTSSLVIVATKTRMEKIRTSKGVIYKHVPPLSGLIGLEMATCCTIDGIVGTLLLILISTYIKLRGSYLKSGKTVQYVWSSSW
jgi:hypothetical protein